MDERFFLLSSARGQYEQGGNGDGDGYPPKWEMTFPYDNWKNLNWWKILTCLHSIYMIRRGRDRWLLSKMKINPLYFSIWQVEKFDPTLDIKKYVSLYTYKWCEYFFLTMGLQPPNFRFPTRLMRNKKSAGKFGIKILQKVTTDFISKRLLMGGGGGVCKWAENFYLWSFLKTEVSMLGRFGEGRWEEVRECTNVFFLICKKVSRVLTYNLTSNLIQNYDEFMWESVI